MSKKQLEALKVMMEEFRRSKLGPEREKRRVKLLVYLAGCLDGLR